MEYLTFWKFLKFEEIKMKYSILVALLAGQLNAYSALDNKLLNLLEEELDDIKNNNITLREYLSLRKRVFTVI